MTSNTVTLLVNNKIDYYVVVQDAYINSYWFQMEPRPHDTWLFTFKNEGHKERLQKVVDAAP